VKLPDKGEKILLKFVSFNFAETVEESSTSRSKYEQKIKQLQDVNKHLDLELQNFRSNQVDMGLLGDGVSNVLNPITAVTKSLARRVVSLAPTSTSSIIPQTSQAQRSSSPTKSLSVDHVNLEECMRKVSLPTTVLISKVHSSFDF
jgi:hypothetical protein